MRNIALLEWGPASLFYIQPRERIKVRTRWLEGGPQMPPFLSNAEDAKAHASDLCVRYALSAFEDLNGAIRNLRRCFGFPYQEYIGYLNTLTRKHRARREHEALLPGLRRWAIFGNVDAVVWIDYAKSNQPPGSFKVGRRESRPFSSDHMEICTDVPSGGGTGERDGEESEVAWSEAEEEQAAVNPVHGGSGPPPPGDLSGSQARWGGAAVERHDGSRRGSRAEGAAHGGGVVLAGLRAPLRRLRSASKVAAVAAAAAPGSARGKQRKGTRPVSESRGVLRPALQEEVLPAHGSIYQRSITPGPGYYGTGAPQSPLNGPSGPSFGQRRKHLIDQVVTAAEAVPGPGDYEPKPPLAEVKQKFGRFGRADKMLSPVDAARKLPFISRLASACEGFGVESPSAFHSVSPDAPCHTNGYAYAPKYTFSKSRRPF